MTKKELRTLYKQKRLALTPQQVLKLADLLLIQFQRLNFSLDTQLLLSYFPMADNREIDPHLFRRHMRLSLPQLQIAYPVINAASCTMQSFLVEEETSFKQNIYGIQEPENGILVEPENIDVVFVPLLAFDNTGYRVGYGKGYYDRYLATCSHNVITIGFSYFEAIDKIEDTNQFDLPLNYCITPHQLYEF